MKSFLPITLLVISVFVITWQQKQDGERISYLEQRVAELEKATWCRNTNYFTSDCAKYKP